MGNSRWRLETTLNYAAQQVRSLSREKDVEILVADWGSDEPLMNVLRLSDTAWRIVSFLWINPEIAGALQKDSPFPEVLALNAAVRSARGDYIGRIDQDTLVGERFFELFFDCVEGRRCLDVPLDRALLYANRRDVPYGFAVRCPPLYHVERFIALFGRQCSVPRLARPFWTYWVGIWLIHRLIWHECGGYDERYLYYNWMETEMILRLSEKYPLVDLGALVDYSFYHLEHVNPRIRRRRHLDMKTNARLDCGIRLTNFCPNSADWGLASFPLEVKRCLATNAKGAALGSPSYDWVKFAALLILTAVDGMIDWFYVNVIFGAQRWFNATADRWLKRARKIRDALRGHPLDEWPDLLLKMNRSRKPRRGSQNRPRRNSGPA
jgi:hypothetical protein